MPQHPGRHDQSVFARLRAPTIDRFAVVVVQFDVTNAQPASPSPGGAVPAKSHRRDVVGKGQGPCLPRSRQAQSMGSAEAIDESGREGRRTRPEVTPESILGWALALAPALAFAQNPGPTASEPVESLEPVVVTAQPDDPIGATDAASRGSVGGLRLQSRPLLRPADVLEWIPGMIVTQHSGDGKANQYFLRGFNLDHGTDFATTVAGVPVNFPTHAHGHGYTDLNFLIPELVERVNYRKGPYAAFDGDFSSAGAADIQLRSRLARPIAQITVGQNDYRRVMAAASPEVAGGRLLIGGEALGADGPWDVPQDSRRLSGVLRYTGGTSANAYDITFMGYDAKWTATDQVPQRALDSGLIGRYGSLDPTTGGDSSRYSLSAGWRRAVDGGRIEASAWALRYRLNLFSNFTYFDERPETGDQFEQEDRRTAGGVRVARIWNHTLFGMRSQSTLGFQGRNDRIDVGLYDTQARQRLATTRADHVQAQLIGVYGEHLTVWSDRIRTVAGVRVDQARNQVEAGLPENSGRSDDVLVSPKLSVIFQPTERLETFANYGRGFHSNDARGTLTRIDPRTGEAVNPVSALVPSTGYELGARAAVSPTLVTSLTYWWLRIGSELVFVGDAGTTEPSRASRRRGFEWNTRWTPVPWLAFDLDVAASNARFTEEDPAGPFIPGSVDRVASLGVTLQRLGAWSGGLRVRHVGPRPLIEDGSVRSQPFTLADLRVGYRVKDGVDLLLDVFNVANRQANDIEYYYRSRLSSEAEGVDDRHVHPSEPRTIRMSLRLGF